MNNDLILRKALIDNAKAEWVILLSELEGVPEPEYNREMVRKVQLEAFGQSLTRKIAFNLFKIAASICILFGLSFVTLMAIPSVRADATQKLNESVSEYIQLHFEPVQAVGDAVFNSNITPAYVPKGYTEIERTTSDEDLKRIAVQYSNGEYSFYFTYNKMKNHNKYSTDIFVSNAQKIKIGEHTATYIPQGSKAIMVLPIDNYVFSIDGDISINEMIKILESINC